MRVMLAPPRPISSRTLAYRKRTALGRGLALLVCGVVFSQLGSCSPSFRFPEEEVGSVGGTTSSGGPSTVTATTGSGGSMTVGGTAGGGEGGTPPLEDLCDNGRKDAGETDEDCGSDCPPCEDGLDCQVDSDCVIASCVQGTCQPPACDDGELSPEIGESDEDCGGQCAECDDGQDCNEHTDCASGVCKSSICQIPNCSDNTLNGIETDVDCGGGEQDDGDTCDRCTIGSICVRDSDCVTPDPEFGAVSKCEDADPDDGDDTKRCVLKCPPNQGDCNQSHLDGCETDLNVTTEHCGSCDADCAPAHAEGQCVAGNCQLVPDSCVAGFDNCNGSPTDGCEVDISIDPNFCGSCEVACSDNHGTATCTAGVCGIMCDPDFDDCNENVEDGCEVDLSSSTLHCSDCNMPCTAEAGLAVVCDAGVCRGVECGDDACGGETPCGACDEDRTCNDLLDTEVHCGGCGIDCVAENGTPVCLDEGGGTYACAIGSCTAPFADCDGNLNNGCEVNTSGSTARCGGCLASDTNPGSGENCAAAVGSDHIAETSCSSGDCTITSCTNGWADCDGNFGNGCEVDIRVNGAHCGGCRSGPTTQWDGGIVCDEQFNNGNGDCVDGQCVFDSCTGTWGDCNGDGDLGQLGNACETNTNTNRNHCGACSSASGTPSGGVDCADAIGSDDVASVNCDTGDCEVGTCTPNHEDCNLDFDDGCEVDTASDVDHCGDCNTPCPDQPHATATGCSSSNCEYDCDSGWRDENTDFSDGCETAIITVVSPPNLDETSHTSRDTSTGTALTISHTLVSSPGDYRLLLVAVACKGNSTANCYPGTQATFGSGSDTIPLAQLGATNLVNQTGAAIYYALDEDLPEPGTYTVTLLNLSNGSNALSAHVMELTGVEQDQFWQAHGGVTNSASCSTGSAGQADVQVTLNGLPSGSRVLAVVAGAGGSIYTNALAPLLDDVIGSQSQNNVGFGTAWSPNEVSGTQTPAFELALCNSSNLYAVGIRPESDY